MERIYTGNNCGCKRGVERDNCPQCEGTGKAIDFRAMRARTRNQNHTPGPWKVHKPKADDVGDYMPIQNGIYEIARIYTCYLPEREANARLIAAAPELLEACKMVLNSGILHDLCGDHSGGHILSEVRAAIAKAEGGK